MEFNPNFTYMLYSAMAEDNVYHKDTSLYVPCYLQTVTATAELRHPVYTCVSASAVNFKVILALMAKVDWEVKEVMSEHSQYVDILLRVRQSACCRTVAEVAALCTNSKTCDVLLTGAADIQHAP
jgi:hypothetical protein